MISKTEQNATLIATILASSMAFIDSTALNVALPALQQDLNMKGSSLLWVVNGYALFLSALLLIGGSLGDQFGRIKIFKIGIIVFTGASVFCGLADSSLTLIIARCIQGAGGAMMVPGSLSIIVAVFPKEKRGMAIGTWSMFSAITTVIGPALGGWLAGQGYWRMIFFINVPLAIIALLVLTKVQDRQELSSAKLDIAGAFFATLALVGITYGFIEAPNYGFQHPYIYGALTAGFVFFILFLITEQRAKMPMMPLHLFKSRLFSSTNAITFFIYGALGAVLFFLPLNLIQVQNYPAELAGLTVVPFGLLIAIFSRWSGQMADKIGTRFPLIIGPMLTAVGFYLFSLPDLTAGPRDFWTTFFPAIVVMGVGMGITVAPLTTAVMSAVPYERTGTASGVNNTIARTAGVVAIAVMGSLGLITFENSLKDRVKYIGLNEAAQQELQQEIPQLAEAKPPEEATPQQKEEVKEAVKFAFIDVFKQTTLLACILAGLSVLTSYLFIRKKR